MAHAAKEIEKERSHDTCSRGDREGKKSWPIQQRRSRRKEVMAHAAEEIEKEKSHGTCSRGDREGKKSSPRKAIAGQMRKEIATDRRVDEEVEKEEENENCLL
jgi:hypothetical protein